MRSTKKALEHRAHDLRRDFNSVMGSFAAALSLAETAANALDAAENAGKATAVSSEISTLRQGVEALRRVYTQLDLATMRLP